MNRSQPSRPLGGGLGSVIRSQLPPGVEALANARTIDIARLSPNPFQPRRTFDPHALAELAASIRADGVLQPLLVRADPAREGYYQIGAGERRWQAARRAEVAAVPCLVRDLSDDDMERLALVENVQRDDLTPLDEARAYQRMMARLGLSMRALSDQLGKSHMYVENRLKLLSDPRVEAAVEAGTLGSTVAQEIATLDEDTRADVLDRATRGERIRVKDVQALREVPATRGAPNNLAGAPPASFAPGGPAPTRPTAEVPNNLAAPSAPPPSDQAPTWLARPDQQTIAPSPASPVQTATTRPPAEGLAQGVGEAVDPGHVRLRDLHLIQLREGRDGEPRQLDTADIATVLRILRADLAWVEDRAHHATREVSVHD